MNDLIFRGKIDETEVGRVHEGMPVKLTIGALQNLSSVSYTHLAIGTCALLIALGVLAGLAPAYRAMAIKPIEASRDE